MIVNTKEELKEFMYSIEPLLDLIVKNMYVLYYNSSCKMSNDKSYIELEGLVDNFESSNVYISNYLESVRLFISSKNTIIGWGDSLKQINAIEYLKENEKFNYHVWGAMHKNIQRNYLRVYQYYSKTLYELSKPKIN